MQDFRGRIGVITGGGNGIGRACARLFAAEGMQVVVADISLAAAEDAAAEIFRAGGKALAFSCDVSKRDQVQELATRIFKELGHVDLLFANAGITSFRRMVDTSIEEWDRITGVDYDGVSQCIRVFLPPMLLKKRGHIVATSSVAGLIPSLAPNHVPYSAAKAGVIGLVVNLRLEVAESGVACSVVCPGKVTTDILSRSQSLLDGEGGKEFPQPVATSFAVAMKTRTPDQAATVILDGIKKDQLFIFTDSSPRPAFDEYVKEVHAGFASTAAFESLHEMPDADAWPWK
jgi:NAD(P)-dependent dehydrogenase (short-subunit alcohol dehydrogenase family)